MMKNIQLHNSISLWERFLDWNPQLFREIKGKLKTRNVVIAAAISTLVQFVVVISLLGELPAPETKNGYFQSIQSGRYGFGSGYGDRWTYTKDMFDNWVINWQLLWLDLFIALSIISIFALLIVGTYMLVADTVKEESRGTLNFIRLTPQSAGSILLGKILGVPILLYVAMLLFLPLHFTAGLGARIPLTLILSFYGVIVASCAFFYSLALLWSLMNFGSSFKPWLASGAMGLFLFSLTTALFHHPRLISNTLWDWLLLFNPSIVLSYLIDATYLPQHQVDFLPVGNLGELVFYGQAWWTKASWGIGFVLFNLSLWIYWCWSVLKRRFHNPQHTLIGKSQSYWITGWIVAIALGFTLQNTSSYRLTDNFILLQFCLGIFGLGLIAALSPHRQALHDWARYRHQTSREGNVLWKELVFGENSPSTVAVAINLAIAIAYITPSILLHLDRDRHYTLLGFILGAGSIILCAIAAQLILTMKTRKRSALSIITVASMLIIPPLCLGIADIYPQNLPQAWLFSFIPTIATKYATTSAVLLTMLGQWLGVAVIGFQMTRKLQQAGASETKMLLDRTNSLND
ncbi:hypothetical protein IQ255_14095 [Pleurocapsales cyanobacterium LEGE 10410]|nr:hypothetical protein [Pleurocapsales cyanobacterium LEGE 10410]